MPTATRSPATRDRILERSVELASTEGLEALTIGRLAGDLEMSKSGLFAHFGSKQELQVATVDAAVERFIETVVRPALEADAGAPRLRALCDSYLDHLEDGVFPGGCFFAQAGHEFDGRPGPVRDRLAEGQGAWHALFEDQAREAGAAQPERLAFELLALAQGVNSRFQLHGDPRVFGWAREAVAERLRSVSRP